MPTCLEHKHDNMSRNYHGCSDISGLCSNNVCSSQNFGVIVLEHKPDTWCVHLWQLFSETTLYTVRLQLYTIQYNTIELYCPVNGKFVCSVRVKVNKNTIVIKKIRINKYIKK